MIVLSYNVVVCSENKGADKLRNNTTPLICVFVFAFAKGRFPHDAAHIKTVHGSSL